MVDLVSNQTTVVVRDHQSVDLLLKITSARCLAPFMREDHTLGSAAAELGMPASSLAYWVGRFQRAGLLRITRHRSRAGKPIPIYRAVADEFHVPLDALPPGRRDEFINGSRRHVLAEFAASMDQAIAREFVRGIRVSSHPVRGMQIDFVEGDQPVSATVTEWWAKVQLTDEEAVELREALEDLARRFGGDRPGPAKKNYITMFGLVPEHRKG